MSLSPVSFPDPRTADDNGVVCWGGALDAPHLIGAYARGIFPWPVEDPAVPLLWFSPPRRGVLDFSELKVSRSLRRLLRLRGLEHLVDGAAPAKPVLEDRWHITVNQNFAGVIQACRMVPRPGQNGTWLTAEMVAAYSDLHARGWAHSVEVIGNSGAFLGGIYGVWIQGYFSAESMFFHESGASKVALLALVDWLKGKGVTWMDVQMVTSASEGLGAKLIPREEFLKRIGDKALSGNSSV